PLKLAVITTGDKWVMMCWKQPLSGNALGYLVVTHHNDSSMTHNVTAAQLGLKKDLLCTSVSNLEKWSNYTVQVAGWNNEEVGIRTPPVSFSTRVNRKACEVDIDDCDPYPCFNNATCIDGLNNYACICQRGFEGDLCQHNIDECMADPCLNGAVCIDKIGSYLCNCPQGYDGDYCEDEIDECMSLPCLNGGVCTDAFNDFSCDCPSGFNGKRCEWDVDLCQSQPCQNGAECIDLVDHFSCKCRHGYEGILCELKVQCPAEVLQTDRGTFLWKPVEHGIISRLLCPYGMDTNYTEFYSNWQEFYIANTSSQHFAIDDLMDSPQHSRKSKEETKYNNKKTNYFNNTKKMKDELKRLSVTYKQTSIKLQGHLKDVDSARTQQFSENDELRKKMESRLQVDNEGRAYAVRSCLQWNDGSVAWTNMVDSICRDKHSTFIEKWSQDLEQLTKDPTQINVEVFINTSIQIRKILEYAISDKKIAQTMFSVMSNMMAVNDTVLDNGDRSGNITRSLVQVIDTYSSFVKLSKSGKIVIVTENLALETREYSTPDSLCYSPPKTLVKQTAIVLEDGAQVNEGNQDILINIPREAIDKALKQVQILRLQFVYYKNSKFFRANNVNSSLPSNSITKQHVISASVSGIHIGNLTEPLEYLFHNFHGNAKQKCVYWDPESQEWLDDGIETNQSSEWIQCQSSHMTAFSVLLDPQLGTAIPDKHRQLLSIISYVGSTCSIVGLFLTILTYSLFRCLNRDRSGKIVLNLSISLLLMNIAFLLVTLEQYVDNHRLMFIDICTAVAVATHYLVLTSLMWMLVEALNMYQLLITVFATAETRFMCKRMFCAWGVPLVIVGGTVCYDLQFYNSSEADYCMVTTSKPILYYIAYLGPSCLILVINCIVFILVSKVLFQRRIHGIGKMESPIITVAQIRGAFTVMTLLGVTWVFGALALGEAKLVFQYIFCISNSLQGFIIFVVRCVQYPEARMAWLTLIHTGKLKKHRGSHGGYGMPSSSHSRHTISSSTHSEIQARHRASSTRKTSRNSSLWSRLNKYDAQHKSNSYSYSNSSFHNTLRSSCSSEYKPQCKTDFLKESSTDGNSQSQGSTVGDSCHMTPISDKLRKSVDFLSRSQSMDMGAICSKSNIALSLESNRHTCSLKRGSSMRVKEPQIPPVQEKQQSGSQQSLSTKEGEDTSWQFMRAPPDGMSESKPSTIVESQTTNLSHSDQGYMSGVCTAEHSPESPHLEPKQAITPQSLETSGTNEGSMKTPELYADVKPSTEVKHTAMICRLEYDF
ncbi:hypothetical protein L9F63_024126, partial [Diploptera punctata]